MEAGRAPWEASWDHHKFHHSRSSPTSAINPVTVVQIFAKSNSLEAVVVRNQFGETASTIAQNIFHTIGDNLENIL
eukprot:2317303-Amphidinium_carterae.1